MNPIYPLIRNSVRSALNVIAEAVVATHRLHRLPAGLLATLPAAMACAAPVGGQISSGSGQITQNGGTTTIEQQSNRLAINWDSFNILNNESVRFNQPGRHAIVLNRVLGQNPTTIHGNLSANGQVFILNPNGILFTKQAQVNVGGLLATTMRLNDSDFMNGNYVFSRGGGSADARVINHGTITADGGYIAFLAPKAVNRGTLTANGGKVILAAGSQMTLTLGEHDLLTLDITQGMVDALVENSGLIQADGGVVVLNSRGKEDVLSGVVNNTGVIQARTVGNKKGVIRLLAESGTVKVNGTLDASAPEGGDGGDIQTSGDRVRIDDNARITTAAPAGKTGMWVNDANNHVVGNEGSDISANTLSRMLEFNNVTLGASSRTGDGSIRLNNALRWNAGTTLNLQAQQDINLNAAIIAALGGLRLKAGNDISAQAEIRLRSFDLDGGKWKQVGAALAAFSAQDFRINAGTFLRMGGGDGSRGNAYKITDIYGLQGIGSSPELLSKNYQLINNIDASGTARWHDGKGFAPIGSSKDGATFTGNFDGQGHTIENINIDRPEQTSVGLFGGVNGGAEIDNVELKGGRVVGGDEVGALAGSLGRATISNSSSSAAVSAVASKDPRKDPDKRPRGQFAGGLVGAVYQSGTVKKSHATGAVKGTYGVGGLAGWSYGVIDEVHASGNVAGEQGVGGLVGVLGGQVSRAYATGTVRGKTDVGGLVGESRKSDKPVNPQKSLKPDANQNGRGINYAYAAGDVSGQTNVGGLVGHIRDDTQISNTRAVGDVSGQTNAGGLIGKNGADPSAISGSYWDTQTSGQSNSAGGEGRTTRELRDIGMTSLLAGAPPPVAPSPVNNRPVVDTSPAGGSQPAGVAPPPAPQPVVDTRPVVDSSPPGGTQSPDVTSPPSGARPSGTAEPVVDSRPVVDNSPAGGTPPVVDTSSTDATQSAGGTAQSRDTRQQEGTQSPSDSGVRKSINAMLATRWTDPIGTNPPAHIADLISITTGAFKPDLAINDKLRPCDNSEEETSRTCE